MKKEPLSESEYLENLQNVKEGIFNDLNKTVLPLIELLGRCDDYFHFTAKIISKAHKVRKNVAEELIISYINENNNYNEYCRTILPKMV